MKKLKVQLGYKGTRDYVRKRDNYKCQICGKKKSKGGRELDVRHTDEREGKGFVFQEDHKPETMITLCRKCHLNLPHVRKRMSEGRLEKNRQRNKQGLLE